MNLTDILTRPRDFFAALAQLPPKNGRYFFVVLLSAVAAAIAAYISALPGIKLMSSFPGGSLNSMFGIIGGLVGVVITWLILWGLGSLGAGKEGRAAEVYGATFLLPLLLTLILIPLAALMPIRYNLTVPQLDGLDPKEMQKVMAEFSLKVQQQTVQSPISIIQQVLGFIGMAWQFYVAWIGFQVLTGDKARANKGVLIPLVIFVLLGLAGLLLTKVASGAMGTGAA